MRLRDLLVPYKGRQHARLRVAAVRNRLLSIAFHGRAHHVDAPAKQVHVPEAVEVDDDVERAVGGHGPVVAVLGLGCSFREECGSLFGSVCVEGCSPCRERVVGCPAASSRAAKTAKSRSKNREAPNCVEKKSNKLTSRVSRTGRGPLWRPVGRVSRPRDGSPRRASMHAG